jgi:hypothetical protein
MSRGQRSESPRPLISVFWTEAAAFLFLFPFALLRSSLNKKHKKEVFNAGLLLGCITRTRDAGVFGPSAPSVTIVILISNAEEMFEFTREE